MNAAELVERARDLGATFTVPEPGRVHVSAPEPLPDELMSALRELKLQVLELLTQGSDYSIAVCSCNPLPSVKLDGHLAHAGCGPGYERCDACGYTWRCKLCGGCRRCRTPG